MGIYLNSINAYTLYKSETEKPYFVDKSEMLKELFPLVETGNNHICITRPRRFGKTVMANMIDSFFSRAYDSKNIFRELHIAEDKNYGQYLNRYPVVHISFNDMPKKCASYEQYIERVERRLIRDLRIEYPEVEIDGEEAVWDAFMELFAQRPSERFIFILDEWDFIFHQQFISEVEKESYLAFLRNLLKDRPYVKLAYMTGILPIAKYSSGSELNMFAEYTMVTERRFAGYFGFTEKEVDLLFEKYERESAGLGEVTREGLKKWYDGYFTKTEERLYNPRSVVMALSNSNLGNYWTSAGPYDEIYYYIENNISAVRDDLAHMMSGTAVPAKIREYAATSQSLQTREEIFSAMVVYGFLSYNKGKVSIPNKELMDKFADMLQKESSLGYIYRLAKESQRMLRATLDGDTKTMEEILERAHDVEIPLLSYNNEADLTAVVNLVYLSARDTYRVERESRAGRGYVDFIFYPETDTSADGIILELKVDHEPEEAIMQIKEKRYAEAFGAGPGEKQKFSGRILGVGIGYDKKSKIHRCKVEILRESL
ncbi:MAG: AAA family ATPase [Dorea sp.]|nr:AAA family ATPase [Dorea sp.]